MITVNCSLPIGFPGTSTKVPSALSWAKALIACIASKRSRINLYTMTNGLEGYEG